MTHLLAGLLLASSALANPAPLCTGTVLVSTRGNNEIVCYDAAANREVARFDAGLGAHEIACSKDGKLAVGSAYGSGEHHKTPDQRLFVIDIPGRKVARVIDLGADHIRPNDLIFFPDNRHILCTSEVKKSLLKIDTLEGNIVKEVPFGAKAGHMVAASPKLDRAYVPSVFEGKLIAIDLDNGEVLASIPCAFGSEGVACSPDGATVWVANNRSDSITVIDAAKLEAIDTFKAEGFPFRIRFTPDGTRVAVSFPMAGEVRVFDAATRALLGAVKLDADGKESMPTSLAAADDSRHIFVTCGGIDSVAKIDVIDLKLVALMKAGPDADGLAWSPAAPG